MKFIFDIFLKSAGPLIWLQGRLKPKQFIIVGAILVGLSAGLAAVVLKQAVFLCHKALTFISREHHWATSLGPMIGIALCVIFVKYFNRNKLGRGLSNILHSIARKSSLLPKDQTYSHVVTSAFTVGFGGSAGVESPIVTTGSALGSNFGSAYKLSYKERTLLLACGAAAGIAGAFNTPIAGVLFTLEVLLVEANISAFIPILIAAASGALCSKMILGEEVLLYFRLNEPFDYFNVPFYFLLGIFCGVFSVYYSRIFRLVEGSMKPIKEKLWLKVGIAGAGLFFMVFLFPPLLGDGYEVIKQLSTLKPSEVFTDSILFQFSHRRLWLFTLLMLVILVKPVATALTVGGGGNGGNFAPSLFTGAILGYLFSNGVNGLGFTHLPVSNFTLVAMAGILSGVFHAPLTGIFLIAEITGGYELIIPLMIVSALSYAVSKSFMPMSIDVRKLMERERIMTTSTDDYLLSSIRLETMIEKDFSLVSINHTLRDLVEIVSTSRRNLFPVVDNNLNLKGLVGIDDIREMMFKPELYDRITVREIMRQADYVITEKDDIRSAVKRFDQSQLWNLPVVVGQQYKGFISKSTILEKYRQALLKSSIE